MNEAPDLTQNLRALDHYIVQAKSKLILDHGLANSRSVAAALGSLNLASALLRTLIEKETSS